MRRRELDFWDRDGFNQIVRGWPASVVRKFAQALSQIQGGETPPPKLVRHLKGFNISLSELKHRSGQRVVYTVAFANETDCIHIIDAFMKDSKDGDTMRRRDKERIESRVAQLQLRVARVSGGRH